MNNQDLKQYVKAIYEMESSIFMMNNLWTNLDEKRDVLRNYSGEGTYKLEKKYNYFNHYDEMWCDEGIGSGIGMPFVFAFAGAIVGLILTFIIFHVFKPAFFFTFVIIGFLIPLLIPAFQCIADSIDVDRINNDIKKQNTIIENENRLNIAECRRKADVIEIQMSKVSDIYNETTQVLNTYYDMDIIYPKYRNFVAISSFYEYLVTGRCSTLEGHGGVYDTYEYESRLDRIITKLDDILESLEEIKANQFQLYTAINNGFSHSHEMYNNILSSLDNINENQEINNFYSQQSASNTEFLRLEKVFSSM